MNITNINNITLLLDVKDKCVNGITTDIGCIYDIVCTPIKDHFIFWGIALILIYIFLKFFMKWFLGKGYIKFKDNKLFKSIFGDLDKIETKAYWSELWHDILLHGMSCFIIIIIYFSYLK